MNRGAPAVLLGGWLLMLPPCIEDRATEKDIDIQCEIVAPLTAWTVGGKYDSKRQCKQSAKRAAGGCWHPDTDGMSPEAAARALTEARVKATQWANYRCVPAEHIYPPKTPPSSN